MLLLIGWQLVFGLFFPCLVKLFLLFGLNTTL
jgi:general stress protein CsbA